MDGDKVSRERLIEIGRELATMARTPQQLSVRAKRGMSAALVPAVHGSVMYAVELGEAALDLVESGRELVASPLMRACYESSLTAAWLVQNPEAVFGFVNEETRQRRNISAAMSESVTEVFREGASRMAHLDRAEIETNATAQARHMQQLCGSLRGGADAYLYYRFMSSFAHISAMVVDHYVEETDDNPSGLRLHVHAKPHGHDAWLFMTVASMMWALRALDHLDLSHTARSALRRYARELTVNESLRLTPEAESEAAKAEQKRRQSEWKGPRKKDRAEHFPIE